MSTGQVGEKIRQIREFQNVSLKELGARSGLSLELIKQIEEEKAYPSLSPLIKIARALGVRLGTFLDDDVESNCVLVKKDEHCETERFPSKETKVGDLHFEPLGFNKRDRYMEPFLITATPEESKDPLISTHEGEEFLYILEGEIIVTYGKEIYVLKPGDSIYYDSVVPHNVRCGAEPAKFVAVVYTPL